MSELKPEVKKEIEITESHALSLKVTDNMTYEKAGELLKASSDLKKKIISFFKPLKQSQDKAKKVLLDAEKEEIGKLTPGIDHLNKEMTTWNLEQENIRQAEEDKLSREAEAKAEDEKLAAALEAEESGNSEEAEEIMNETMFIPPPTVEKSVPKIAGQTMTTTWKWRVKDERKVPREFMMINEVAINAHVKGLKDKANIPGIESYPESKMRGVRL